MPATSDDPGRLPSEEQLLIIRAALLPGAAGEAAGTAWLAQADINRLGKAARRLLPLLYERFAREGRDHPILPILKGVKRHTWYNNQRLLIGAQHAVAALDQLGIEVMILKGGAMTLQYYRDSAMRPMEDIDLMVRYQDAAVAIQALRQTGFLPADGWLEERGFAEDVRRHVHATHFRHLKGQALDLHWNLMPYALGPEADADLWTAAGRIDFHGHSVRTLNPADQLLHVCVHGATWDTLSPIRWIPDAVAVIGQCPDLDWNRLVTQARQRRVTLIAAGALAYLRDALDDIVPASVLAEIKNQRSSFLERMEYNTIIVGPAGNPVHSSISILSRYMRASHNHSLAARMRMLPGFLRTTFRVGRTRDLPKEMSLRAARSWARFLFGKRAAPQAGQLRS